MKHSSYKNAKCLNWILIVKKAVQIYRDLCRVGEPGDHVRQNVTKKNRRKIGQCFKIRIRISSQVKRLTLENRKKRNIAELELIPDFKTFYSSVGLMHENQFLEIPLFLSN